MKIRKIRAKVFGKDCSLEVMDFVKSDGKKWKELFDIWKKLKTGLRDYQSREPNLPEGISEVAFCLWSGSSRFISASGALNTSFDTFNTKTGRAEQVKASSVKSDLTSFGPESKWDDIYFLDFYNEGKLDGTFNVYLIPTKLIYGMKVNKNQTFIQQQIQKRRPRFSIVEKIIIEKSLKPKAKDVKVW